VEAAAKVTSKGQVTVPKAVREALGIREGDEVVFRVEGNRAVLARTADSSSWPGRSACLLRSEMWHGMRFSFDRARPRHLTRHAIGGPEIELLRGNMQ